MKTSTALLLVTLLLLAICAPVQASIVPVRQTVLYGPQNQEVKITALAQHLPQADRLVINLRKVGYTSEKKPDLKIPFRIECQTTAHNSWEVEIPGWPRFRAMIQPMDNQLLIFNLVLLLANYAK